MSYKGLLIEWCQKNKKKIVFDTFEDSGNQNQNTLVLVYIDQVVVTKGRATSKKKAEEIAAKRAYFKFQSKI